MTDIQNIIPESSQPRLPRVVLLITRAGLMEPELQLVTVDAHPLLPEDVVAADETPEDAVERLAGRLLPGQPHVQTLVEIVTEPLSPNKRAVLRPQFLRTAPQPDATLMRFMLDRGAIVQSYETSSGYTRVVYQEFALSEGDFALTTRRAGWMTSSALCASIEHSLYHLPLLVENAPVPADVVWTPFSRARQLLPGRQAWIDRLHERLFGKR